MEPPIEFVRDHREVLRKLSFGRFLLVPWEAAEDHEDWCLELITLSVEYDVEVHHEQVPPKSITVVFNGQQIPPLEAIRYGIRRIEHRRFMRRDGRKLIVSGHRVTPGGLVIPST
ncbi:hypothetical protein ACIBCH_20500 [Amycolatopsis thailandensis]|uniref:hypothetical protein n=1 Tax=Amycolatopsis thailandensis TaxID=589330 RepID=UPI0037997B04